MKLKIKNTICIVGICDLQPGLVYHLRAKKRNSVRFRFRVRIRGAAECYIACTWLRWDLSPMPMRPWHFLIRIRVVYDLSTLFLHASAHNSHLQWELPLVRNFDEVRLRL